MTRFVRLASILAALSALLPAQTNWFPIQTAGTPPGRCSPAMASDPFRQVSVLFGGADANNQLGDTWEFQGSRWTRVNTPNSPPAREDSRLVYDWSRRVMILFGGFSGTVSTRTSLADLWEYDGADWKRIQTPNAPPTRGRHGMVFDFIRNVVVVFGGTHIQNGQGSTLGDTWEWDGVQWLQVSTTNSPPARASCGMVFRWQGETFLFGGAGANGPLQDTWIYDGKDWMQKSPTRQPQAQVADNLSYDQRRDRCVFLDSTSATWEWDGGDWRKPITAAAPARREKAGTVFDLDSGRLVLFGGCVPSTSAPLSDTWIYRATQPATAATLGTSCGAPSLLVSSSGLPWIGGQLFLLMLNVPARENVWLALGGSATSWNGVPLPLDLTRIGYTGCSLLISPDFVGTVYSPNGIAAQTYSVPNNPALIGADLFAQALARAPGANPAGWVTTNGLHMTIGSR